MNGTKGKKYLKSYIKQIAPILDKFLSKEVEEAKDFGSVQVDLMQAYKDMITAGKGIRGSLIYLFYQICGGKNKREVLKTSTFIELFHSAILIHDDFMDRDPFRRGMTTIHKLFADKSKKLGIKVPADHFGYSIAVCVGDSGFYLSWETLINSKLPKKRVLEAGNLYARYVARLGLGQSLDMTITGDLNASEKDILKVIWAKSGEYTSELPILVGAALAGEKNKKRLKAIKSYAKCFGWAFHIQDDILGLYADEAKLGKPVGSDLREGKNTLLMLHLRDHGNREQKAFQKKILGNSKVTKKDTEKMRKILKDAGSYQYVIDIGWKYVEEGKKYIPQITKNKKYQEILESLLVFMMERAK